MKIDDLIKKKDECVVSSNPLRFGEPGVSFGAQTNTWGQNSSPQKQLILSAVCVDDIEHIIAIMDSIGEVTEYTKKLLGRYIILEINSLYLCLQHLQDYDNQSMPKQLFDNFDQDVKDLEAKHGFRAIRNKITAHKDPNLDVMKDIKFQKKITRKTINEYLKVFRKLIQDIAVYYPDEVRMYFDLCNQPMKGIPPSGPMGGYTQFS